MCRLWTHRGCKVNIPSCLLSSNSTKCLKNYYTARIQDRSCGEPVDTILRAAAVSLLTLHCAQLRWACWHYTGAQQMGRQNIRNRMVAGGAWFNLLVITSCMQFIIRWYHSQIFKLFNTLKWFTSFLCCDFLLQSFHKKIPVHRFFWIYF